MTVARGSKVRMRPGARRADAQDLFLIGREALVEAVLHDVDGKVHVAVSPVADPVAELQRTHGRFLYFAPDELEPIGARSPAGNVSTKTVPVRNRIRRRKGMISRLITAVVIAVALAALIESLPDVKRYLELREM